MVRQFKPKEDRLVAIMRKYEYRGHGMAVLLKKYRPIYQFVVKMSSTYWTLAHVVENGLQSEGGIQAGDVYLGELSCVETKLSLAPDLGPPCIQGFGMFQYVSPSLHGFPEVIHSIGDEVRCPLHIEDSLLTLLKSETRCLAFALVLPSRGPGACLPPPIPGTFRHFLGLQHLYWSPFAAAFHKILGHPDAGHSASQLKVGVYVALYELADGPTPKRVEERDPLEVMLLPSTTVATVVSLVLQATAMDWAVEDVWVQARYPIPNSAAISRPVLLDALFPQFVDIQAGTGDFDIHQRLAYADSPVVRDGAMAVAMIGPSKDRRSLPPMMPGSSPTYTHCNSRHSTLWEPMKSISVACRGRSATRYKCIRDE